jgi:hypothetical protein
VSSLISVAVNPYLKNRETGKLCLNILKIECLVKVHPLGYLLEIYFHKDSIDNYFVYHRNEIAMKYVLYKAYILHAANFCALQTL